MNRDLYYQQIVYNYKGYRVFTSEEAIEYYSALIELEPNIFKHYQYRADAKFKLNDFIGTLEDLNTALSLNGTEHEGNLMQRAISLSRLKQYIEATKVFNSIDESLALAMGYIIDTAEYYYERGFVKEKMYDSQGALRDYIRAMKLNPKYAKKCTRIKFINNLYSLIEAYKNTKLEAVLHLKNKNKQKIK